MNYEFKNKNELITYYEGLDSIEKNAFINEIKNDIRNISIRFNVFKKMIFTLFETEPDIKCIILKSGDFAEEAMNLVAPYDSFKVRPYFMTAELINLIASEYVDMHEGGDYYSTDEIVDIVNDYLGLIFKTIYYFSKIYSISNTYSQCLFGLRNPEIKVPKCIYGIYHSYKSKLLNNYKKLLSNIDEAFEEEWNKIKKYMPCKLN